MGRLRLGSSLGPMAGCDGARGRPTFFFCLEPAGNLSPSIFLGNLLGQPLAAHRGDDDDDDDVEKDDDDDDDDDG